MRVELHGASKRFGGTAALAGIEIQIASGAVHALIGDNGAGKSTLARVLAGQLQLDAGSYLLDGAEVRFRSPRDALSRGVAMISQEPLVAPRRSVAENVLLGVEPSTAGLFRRSMAKERLTRICNRVGFELDPLARAGELDLSGRQQVEILRALARDVRVLVMDEPTAALPPDAAERLLDVVRRLRASKVTVVYISHRLAEVAEIADRVTVLERGRVARTSQRHTEVPPPAQTRTARQGEEPVLAVHKLSGRTS